MKSPPSMPPVSPPTTSCHPSSRRAVVAHQPLRLPRRTRRSCLSWPRSPGVTGYYLYSGPASGAETNLVIGNYPGTSYTNTGLVDGTIYFYAVASTNSSGLGPNSPEASATPNANTVNTPALAASGPVTAWPTSWDVERRQLQDQRRKHYLSTTAIRSRL